MMCLGKKGPDVHKAILKRILLIDAPRALLQVGGGRCSWEIFDSCLLGH